MDKDIYGLVGNSIAHSLSPTIHNSLFEKYNISSEYKLFEVKNLASIKKVLCKDRIKGLNITKPFKIDIIDYLDSLDDEADKIGSVNTVLKSERELRGYNTDGIGAKNALKQFTEVKNKKILQLGAGGAGRAIAYELSKFNDVVVLNRDESKAKRLEKFVFKGLKLNESNLKDFINWCDILINTTSVGMGEERSLIDSRMLNEDIVVLDIVYIPLETKLLRDCKKVGCRTIDGLWMLVYQAVECFKLWTGIEPDPIYMRKVAREWIR
ncbi:MAG: shikimate dehydrogenase [Thermoplasmatota archaeon]